MPYASANINRVNLDKHVTKPITREEINSIIKSMNNNSPGQSNINKTIINELTDKAITPIYNYSLSSGYFPTILRKKTTITLIPKANKDKDTADLFN